MILTGPSLSSSTKVVLNGPISDEMTDIGDPVLFTQMLLTKMKEFLEGFALFYFKFFIVYFETENNLAFNTLEFISHFVSLLLLGF